MSAERIDNPQVTHIDPSGVRRKLTVGSLFAGIGGIELGLEWTGVFETKWQVECDSYAQRVLAKHWPNVGRWDDVRTFPPDEGDWHVDLICGGFPCQDISVCGTGNGFDGEQSGLWREFARIFRLLRPRYVSIENSPALTVRGLERVLRDLAATGFDAEWGIISACAFGAPHTRERMFVVAYPKSSERRSICTQGRNLENCDDGIPTGREKGTSGSGIGIEAARRFWDREPAIPRVVDGLPHRLDRLRCLGNAVVPQVAQFVGEMILDIESARAAGGGK